MRARRVLVHTLGIAATLCAGACEPRPELPRIAAAADASVPLVDAAEPVATNAADAPDANTEATDASDDADTASKCTPLPPQRPSDIAIRVSHWIMPHGAPSRLEESDFVASGGTCATDTHCVRTADAKLDAVYQEFRKRAFDRIPRRSKYTYMSPHYGRWTIALRWTSGTCEVSDSAQMVLEDEFHKPFYELIDLLSALLPPSKKP